MQSQTDIGAANSELLESLYEIYQTKPEELDPTWRHYFDTLVQAPAAIQAPFNFHAYQLAEIYRTYGHFGVKVNPIDIGGDDPSKQFINREAFANVKSPELIETIKKFESLYCNRVGFEFKGMQNPQLEVWIQDRIETGHLMQELTPEQKKMILEYLNKSELFESFLHMKYVGQKRFSLEGGETLIPMLALFIEKASDEGIYDFIIGMAHRGRLNVLSNILGKTHRDIFFEFDENYIPESFEGMGDVKYHKGFASDALKSSKGKDVRITLSPNPSHLESVDPVVEGQVRALQFLLKDEDRREKVIPILIHGDAAISGQGIVYETLQMNKLNGFTTGGTIHIVINNQIGFTTIPRDLRSTHNCTDIARTFGAPIFHVNAEDPEACVIATLFALEIRKKFHIDVFIDLNCYRKYGHNESDEPAFTQPLEYQIIKKKSPIRQIYRDQLVHQGIVEKEIAEQLEDKFKKDLQNVHSEVISHEKKDVPSFELMEMPSDHLLFDRFPTGVDIKMLQEAANLLSRKPEGFSLHPKLENLVRERAQMVLENKPLDWGTAETLAYATILLEGISVRISGQDCCRGTFSHRHALWVDQKVEMEYYPLAHLKKNQGRFEIVNSFLSEAAVLGFEYGYSVAALEGLTIWEAQFGDFGNGAQVIIDQYITSGEQKWGQKSGLVLLLPHGYEGQGPEHSSGRIERFLALAGHDNIQIVNPTTPAQLFHLLRRQVLRALHKPLVVFTPKGLLRYPACVSPLKELIDGAFCEILDDSISPDKVAKVVLCSGRIYYDLLNERNKSTNGAQEIALIRIEQLYPLDLELLKNILVKYKNAKEFIWVQEEPQNMGAWGYIHPILQEITKKINYVGRMRSASPATGSHSRHDQEHAFILKQVFKK